MFPGTVHRSWTKCPKYHNHARHRRTLFLSLPEPPRASQSGGAIWILSRPSQGVPERPRASQSTNILVFPFVYANADNSGVVRHRKTVYVTGGQRILVHHWRTVSTKKVVVPPKSEKTELLGSKWESDKFFSFLKSRRIPNFLGSK